MVYFYKIKFIFRCHFYLKITNFAFQLIRCSKYVFMRKFAAFFAFSLFLLQVLMAQPAQEELKPIKASRPKVAVVLSGGGAKGAAHVGALKIIEKANIPVDMVVGTSMGALVGGLYAMGYTTEQMDSLLRAQNWNAVLSDEPDPSAMPLSRKLEQKNYAVSLAFQTKKFSFQNDGLINGVNLGHLFYQLTYPYHGNLKSFNDLPIPFSCVAVDLATGKTYDFHSGSIQDAMRSSMSIPGVFSPVRKDGCVYIDGGMKDNFPTDVARKMGADIVIGVDVGGENLKAEQIKNFKDVLAQTMSVAMGNDMREATIKECDIYIPVNVEGYSSASFTSEAIDTLIQRGNDAAEAKWQELVSLRSQLDAQGKGGAKARDPKPVISMRESMLMEMEDHHTPVSLYKDYSNSSVGANLHYDNIYKVSLLFGANMSFPVGKKTLDAALALKLGQQNYVKPSVTLNLTNQLRLKLGYEYHFVEGDYYFEGSRVGKLDNFNIHKAHLEFRRDLANMMLKAGIEYNYGIWDNIRALVEQVVEERMFYKYYLGGIFTTYDNLKWPTRGHYFETNLKYLSTGFFHSTRKPEYVIELKYETALSLSKKFVLLPKIDYRFFHQEYDMDELAANITQENIFGGLADRIIFDGQRAFAGIMHLHTFFDSKGDVDDWGDANSTLILAVNGRYQFLKKHSIVGTVNTLSYGSKFKRTFKNNKIGGMIGYMYRSFIGPVSLQFHYSNMDEKNLNILVSLGHIF